MITAFVFASAPATLLGPDRIKALEKWSWLGQPQVAVVQLLAQLDVVLTLVVGVRGYVAGAALDGVVLGLSAGAESVLGTVAHGHAVGLEAGGAGEGHHLGAQSVQSHLCNLVTGQDGRQIEKYAKNDKIVG